MWYRETMKPALFAAAFWVLVGFHSQVLAQTTAADIVANAQKKAAAEGKAVFLVFGAPTCAPCKVYKKFRESEEIKPILEKYFVEAALELGNDAPVTPGAEVFEAKYKVRDNGVPFYVFLKPDGTTIIDSKLNKTGENIGFPSAAEEIEWFLKMHSEAARRMTTSEMKMIEKKLRASTRR